MTLSLSVIAVICFFITECSSRAVTPPVPAVSIQKEKGFVQSLFYEKDYSRAILEAKRFLFSHPESSYAEEMEVLIADAHLLEGDYDKAYKLYLTFNTEHPSSDLVREVNFKIGKLLANSHRYDKAILYFTNITDDPESSKSLLVKAKKWIALLSVLVGKSIDESQSFLEREKYNELSIDYGTLNFKSPEMAGCLSAVIPGAGQFYIERKRDALASFILNGIFIWSAVESFSDENIGVGIAVSIIEAGWYLGNIYSAISGSHKHNRYLKKTFKDKNSIEMNINVTESSQNARINIAFNYRF